MKKGDCFLCPGEKASTLYYITSAKGKKCWALRIYYGPEQVQALNFDKQYDKELPDDIICLRSDTYKKLRELITSYVDKMHSFLCENAMKQKQELRINHSYVYRGYIYTLREFNDGKWCYDLFRIEPENVCSKWTGCGSIDLDCSIYPISDENVKKVKIMLEKLQKDSFELIYRNKKQIFTEK